LLRNQNYLKISKSDTYIIVVVIYNMNKNEIGEIEDIIGMLGDIEEHDVGGQGGFAEECAFRLFNLIKPYIEVDIKTGDEHHG